MIFLLRFFGGFITFAIGGSRPAAFLNELLKNGVNVWGVRYNDGEIVCCTHLADYPFVQSLSRSRSQRVSIVKKHGVPFIIHKNRKRAGLAAGAVLFAVIFHTLSLYVWNIELCRFDTISETSAREILGRIGFYEGVRGDFESLKRMQTTALLEFGNLSWITINSDGSRGEVNATEKALAETSDTAPRNMKARADGQIIRIDAYSGTPCVGVGDGVTEGTLLIGGAVTSMDGSTEFVRADGEVTAKTRYIERFAIPKSRTLTVYHDEPKHRLSLGLFGVTLPLTIAPESERTIRISKTAQAEFLGERASAAITDEALYSYGSKKIERDKSAAEQLFKREMLLRELFKMQDKKITDRSISSSDSTEKYACEVRYICEENIAVPARILFQEE